MEVEEYLKRVTFFFFSFNKIHNFESIDYCIYVLNYEHSSLVAREIILPYRIIRSAEVLFFVSFFFVRTNSLIKLYLYLFDHDDNIVVMRNKKSLFQ